MPRVHLVRHGRPLEQGRDPGLDPQGHAQAAAVAERLGSLAPRRIVTSPLQRTRDTAAPLAARWSIEPQVVHAVRELPSPSDDLRERSAWLQLALRGTFAELGEQQRAWRDGIVAELSTYRDDAVVFTHAVVINAVCGHIAGDDRVLAFVPEHCSVTVIDVDDAGRLALVERGAGRAHGEVR